MRNKIERILRLDLVLLLLLDGVVGKDLWCRRPREYPQIEGQKRTVFASSQTSSIGALTAWEIDTNSLPGPGIVWSLPGTVSPADGTTIKSGNRRLIAVRYARAGVKKLANGKKGRKK